MTPEKLNLLAETALEDGDAQKASGLFNQALTLIEGDADAPHAADATAGLLRCCLVAEDLDTAAKVAEGLKSKTFAPYLSRPVVARSLAAFALSTDGGETAPVGKQPWANLCRQTAIRRPSNHLIGVPQSLGVSILTASPRWFSKGGGARGCGGRRRLDGAGRAGKGQVRGGTRGLHHR